PHADDRRDRGGDRRLRAGDERSHVSSFVAMVDETRNDDTAPATSSEPDVGALRFGRYVVLSRIGEGAMGVVFSGYDELLERRVAVKLVRRRISGDQRGRDRLLREAQALAQLSHPN